MVPFFLCQLEAEIGISGGLGGGHDDGLAFSVQQVQVLDFRDIALLPVGGGECTLAKGHVAVAANQILGGNAAEFEVGLGVVHGHFGTVGADLAVFVDNNVCFDDEFGELLAGLGCNVFLCNALDGCFHVYTSFSSSLVAGTVFIIARLGWWQIWESNPELHRLLCHVGRLGRPMGNGDPMNNYIIAYNSGNV